MEKIPNELRCDYCRHFWQSKFFKQYCKCLGKRKRLRNLVRTEPCPYFGNLKPRKDGHIYKTFTALDLNINFIFNNGN
jgi:hypothetical protein